MNKLELDCEPALIITHASTWYQAESLKDVFSLLVDVCFTRNKPIVALVYPTDLSKNQLFDTRKLTHWRDSYIGEMEDIVNLPRRIISVGGCYKACHSTTVGDILRYWADNEQSGEISLFLPALYELRIPYKTISLAAHLDTLPSDDERLEKVKEVARSYLDVFSLHNAKITLLYRKCVVELQPATNESMLHYHFHAIHPPSYDRETLAAEAADLFQ